MLRILYRVKVLMCVLYAYILTQAHRKQKMALFVLWFCVTATLPPPTLGTLKAWSEKSYIDFPYSKEQSHQRERDGKGIYVGFFIYYI